MAKENRKLAISRPERGFALRVYSSKGTKKRLPRLMIKCGCCDEKVDIYHGDGFLEINGVIASIENWRDVLSPLLGAESTKTTTK